MDAGQFREAVELDQRLADYVDEVAQTAAGGGGDRTIGLEWFFVVAAHALLLYVKHHIAHRRGLQEAELRRLMEQAIDIFVQRGHSLDAALAAVQAVSKSIAIQPPDDSVLKRALALLAAGPKHP